MLRDHLAPTHTTWFAHRHTVCKQLQELLEPGDIFVRQGNHTVCNGLIHFSRFVEWLTKSPYSHASLVYKVDDDVLLAEVSDYGMKRIFLIDWLDEIQGQDFLIIRYNGGLPLDKVIQTAEEYIRLDLPYNTSLDYTKPDSLYCIQFIYKCFENAGIELPPGQCLKDMRNWKPWLLPVANVLNYNIEMPMYIIGDEQVGLLSSDKLCKYMHVRLSKIESGMQISPFDMELHAKSRIRKMKVA